MSVLAASQAILIGMIIVGCLWLTISSLTRAASEEDEEW